MPWFVVTMSALAAAVVWGYVWWVFPSLNDDITFSYYHTHPNHGYIADVLAELRWRYSTDNIRLGNMIYMFTVPLGRGFGSSVAAISVLLTFISMWRAAHVLRKPVAMAFGLAAYILALPWYESMSVLDFAFNYVVGACMFTTYYCLFFSQNRSGFSKAGAIMVALLTGCWHEGFSVPLFCGCGVWLIVNMRRASSRQWLLWALLIPGIVLLMTTPGMVSRVQGTPTLSALITPFYYRKFFLSIAYFILLGCIALLPHYRRRLDSRHLLMIIVCLTVMVIRTVQIDIVRPVWAGETMAIVGIMTLWSDIQPRETGSRPYVSSAATILICGIVMYHLIALSVQTSESVREYDEIDKAYLSSTDGLVFYNHTLDYQTKLAALKRPDVDEHYNTWARWSYDIVMSKCTKRLRVVPAVLQNVDLQPGVMCDSNLYLKDGYVYAAGTKLSCADNPRLLMYSTDEITWGVEVDVVDFTTPSGGKFVYFKPRSAFRLLNGHPILDVKYYR